MACTTCADGKRKCPLSKGMGYFYPLMVLPREPVKQEMKRKTTDTDSEMNNNSAQPIRKKRKNTGRTIVKTEKEYVFLSLIFRSLNSPSLKPWTRRSRSFPFQRKTLLPRYPHRLLTFPPLPLSNFRWKSWSLQIIFLHLQILRTKVLTLKFFKPPISNHLPDRISTCPLNTNSHLAI